MSIFTRGSEPEPEPGARATSGAGASKLPGAGAISGAGATKIIAGSEPLIFTNFLKRVKKYHAISFTWMKT